jgi:hypothetical protein
VPLNLASNPHNADYLATKKHRTGHMIVEQTSQKAEKTEQD